MGSDPNKSSLFDHEETVRHDLGDADEPTSKRDALLGTQVGEYVIRRRVGSGGMGVVYEAYQPVVDRRVAIKFVRPELASTAKQMDGLIAEGRAANAIQHRGIIGVFGSGELEGVGRYIVMEYLDGVPLDTLIEERAPMDFAEALPILDDVLAALEAAHARGVIHRDLKPSNVFLVDESNGSRYAKLLDFGLAKVVRSTDGGAAQAGSGPVVGTPEYMAPEQASGSPIGPQTDLYALGVVAYEMLSGRLPFLGDDPMDLVHQQINAKPPRLGTVARHVDPGVEELVMRLLEKAPESRPPSAAATRNGLKRAARELQGALTRTSQPRSFPEESASSRSESARHETRTTVARRRPLRAVALGLAAASVAAGVWFLLARGREPGPAAQEQVEASPEPSTVAAPPVAVQAPEGPPPLEALVPPKPATRPPKKPERPGQLRIALRGAGTLVVDGVERGKIPPMNRIELPPGPHHIEIRSAAAEPYLATVNLRSGEVLPLHVTLKPRE